MSRDGKNQQLVPPARNRQQETRSQREKWIRRQRAGRMNNWSHAAASSSRGEGQEFVRSTLARMLMTQRRALENEGGAAGIVQEGDIVGDRLRLVEFMPRPDASASLNGEAPCIE